MADDAKLPFTFLIQSAKRSGKYETRYSFHRRLESPIGQPMMYFNSINIGNGYKKRLVRVDNTTGKSTTLERVDS